METVADEIGHAKVKASDNVFSLSVARPGLLSPRADVVKPPRGDPALSPWKVESEKRLRASQVGTD